MEGLEVFLQMEMVAAITYIKVIFTVTFEKKKEREGTVLFSKANYFRIHQSMLKIY